MTEGYFVYRHKKRDEWCLFDFNMNLEEHSYKFLRKQKEDGSSGNTLRQYAFFLKSLFCFMDTKGIRLNEFSVGQLQDFRTWYMLPEKKRGRSDTLVLSKGSRVSAKTVNSALITMGHFFKFLRTHGLEVDVRDDDFKDELTRLKNLEEISEGAEELKVKKDTEKLLKVISEEDYDALKSHLNKRDVLIADILYTTGMRIGELFSLKIDKFKAKTSTESVFVITLPYSDSNDRNRQTKSGQRDIFIPHAIYQRISRYITFGRRGARHKYIFVSTKNGKHNKKGSPLSPDTFRMNFRRANRKADLDYGPHDLRHTLATNILRATDDIKFVQQILGHKSLETTTLYTHPSDTETAERFAKVQHEIYPDLLGGKG